MLMTCVLCWLDSSKRGWLPLPATATEVLAAEAGS